MDLMTEIQSGHELAGLFQRRRSSINFLRDPRVLQHLKALHTKALTSDSPRSIDSSAPEVQRQALEEKIFNYNRRVQLEAFQIKLFSQKEQDSVGYQGALRFYFEDGDRKFTKAIQLNSSTTVSELLPYLLDKFRTVATDASHTKKSIYHVLHGDEILLDKHDRPLELALNSPKTPRFVFRVSDLRTQKEEDPTNSEPDYKKSQSDNDHTIPNGVKRDDQTNPLTLNGATLEQSSTLQLKDAVSTRRSFQSAQNHVEHQHTRGKLHISKLLKNAKSAAANSTSDVTGDLVDVTGKREAEVQTQGINKMPTDARNSDFVLAPSMRVTNKRRKQRNRDRSLDRVLSQGTRERAGSLRSSKSMSNIFHKTLSLRRKDTPVVSAELSTEDSAPGVLKIFGDTVCPGATYKSVLATPKSTAKELVKEALHRYSISRKKGPQYVLCDAIGKIEYITKNDNGTDRGKDRERETLWTQECIRVIGDNERPLILQSFWKPEEGFLRRFELRKRSDVLGAQEQDTTTSGINANARRLLISKTRSQAIPNSKLQSLQNAHGYSTDDQSDVDVIRTPRYKSGQYPRVPEENEAPKPLLDSHSSEELANPLRVPSLDPYLLNLKGFDNTRDLILYPLKEHVITIGGAVEDLNPSDIPLFASDIKSKHCLIYITPPGGESVISDKVTYTLEPVPGAEICVNNKPITNRTTMNPGDILSLGKHYVFLFKDPTSNFRESPSPSEMNKNSPVLAETERSHDKDGQDQTETNKSKSSQNDDSEEQSQILEAEPPEIIEWRRRKNIEYENNPLRLKLSFAKEREDDFLQKITAILEDHPEGYKLSCAYVLCMCVEYASVKHDQTSTRDLLLKIASMLQNIVWEKTKILAKRHSDAPQNALSALDDLLPDLHSVLIWMSNGLEAYHFLHKNLHDYLMDSSVALPQNRRASIAAADDEVLSVLEEIVMYTFQQTVYYLTKTLYVTLPAILDSNPFADDDVTSDVCSSKPTMDTVISILQTTLDTVQHYRIHPQIISQLFCYLFFFTSTSLFNTLMAKGAGPKYYKWAKGAQIRGNLDVLESWAAEHDLQREAAQFLGKLSGTADLLATPKVQLIQADWGTILRDNPCLTAAQLHHILSEYQLGPGKQRPGQWCPPVEELDIRHIEVMESFNDHPPLVLPEDGFVLDLCKEVDDPTFYDILNEINAMFGVSDGHSMSDDGDSGLSVSHTSPAFVDIPKSTMYQSDQEEFQTAPNTPNHIVQKTAHADSIHIPGSGTIDCKHLSDHNSNIIHIPTDVGSEQRQDGARPNRRRPSYENSIRQRSGSISSTTSSVDSANFTSTPASAATNKQCSPVRRLSVSSGGSTNDQKQHYDSTKEISLTKASSVRGTKDSPTVQSCGLPTVSIERANSLQTVASKSLRSGQDAISRLSLPSTPQPRVVKRSEVHNTTYGRTLSLPSGSPKSLRVVNKQSSHQQQSSEEIGGHRNRNSVKNYKTSGPVFLQRRSSFDAQRHPQKNFTKSDSPSKRNSVNGNPVTVYSRASVHEYDDEPIYENIPFRRKHVPNRQNGSCSHSSLNEPIYVNIPFRKERTECNDSKVHHEDPVAMSSPKNRFICNDSESRYVTIPPQPIKPAPTLPKDNKGRRPHDVPPLQLPYSSEKSSSETDEANYVEVTARRASCQGLRVLPLTTDDPKLKTCFSNSMEDTVGKNIKKDGSLQNSHADLVGTIQDKNTHNEDDDDEDGVFMVDLVKAETGLGLGLIDGLFTPLRRAGIYVRTLVPGGPAAVDGRLQLGDRILAVNSTSVVGADYQHAMHLIRTAGQNLYFLVARSDTLTAMQITASTC